MSSIDVVGDTGGFLEAIRAAVASLAGGYTESLDTISGSLLSLGTAVAALSALVEVLIVCMSVLVAVEVARGVMRR